MPPSPTNRAVPGKAQAQAQEQAPMHRAPTPITTAQLIGSGEVREFIIMAGKDGSGKTNFLVSIAAYVEMLFPNNRVWVIDTENKFRSALRGFGAAAPQNIQYFFCGTMNHVTEAVDHIVEHHTPGDWVLVESAARVWERAQDMGYQAITGLDKPAYMEKRRKHAQENPNLKALAVTPKPDDLWSIVKGAHDSAFMDVLMNTTTLQVAMSTTVARPPKDRPNRAESPDRKDVRAEFGIDMNIDGAPRLPYYAETLLYLSMNRNQGVCRVVRDNNSVLEVPNVEFDVPTRFDWASQFWASCRG